MDEEKRKKIANNILEFLFDPTCIAPERRLYFRPEEILKNQSYEAAKAEANKAYGDQRHNSDFYPKNKISNEREASDMDRKTLIASMDILSQSFKEEDPIAKDLRTMAYAVSQMSDEELESRLDVEAKAETFPCPVCGTKVLKQTGYCVKCKKKVKPKTAEDETKEASEEKEAEEEKVDMDSWSKEASEAVRKALIADVTGEETEKEAIKRGPGGHIPDGTGPHGRGMGPGKGKGDGSGMKEEEEKKAEETEKEAGEKEAGKIKGPGKPDGTGPMSGTPACPETKKKKKKSEEEKEEATPSPEKKEETTPSPEKKAEEKPVAEEKEAKEEKTTPSSEKKAEEEKGAKKEEEEEKSEEEKSATEPTAVNTDILGIQMEPSMLLPDDIGDLSPEEEQKLSQLFS